MISVYIYRCVPVNGSSNTIGFCRSFYGLEDGYVDGSELSGLRTTLLAINDIFQNDTDNPCVPLMLQYLCHYYFPVCNQTTGEITPVCGSSCALLASTEDCPELREIANSELERNNVVPPDDSCAQTYRSYVNPPVVSDRCLSIEGQFVVLVILHLHNYFTSL